MVHEIGHITLRLQWLHHIPRTINTSGLVERKQHETFLHDQEKNKTM